MTRNVKCCTGLGSRLCRPSLVNKTTIYFDFIISYLNVYTSEMPVCHSEDIFKKIVGFKTIFFAVFLCTVGECHICLSEAFHLFIMCRIYYFIM